ncbi:MAG: hypothetical protein KGL39_28760 [Patescibacteria group bacterium]|nr:hypothetical protein [Patescibacteria group bacterium]
MFYQKMNRDSKVMRIRRLSISAPADLMHLIGKTGMARDSRVWVLGEIRGASEDGGWWHTRLTFAPCISGPADFEINGELTAILQGK